MPSIRLRLATLALLVSSALLWSQLKKTHNEAPLSLRTAESDEGICDPFSIPETDRCLYVQASCLSSETALSIPYLEGYFCNSPAARPFVLLGLFFELFFLFSFISISASDFFCPNLSSISAMLGLDENIAGVTFLAFGNGSPDLFSTFSAMKSGSGSLAVGELLGAGTFIVSVVAGCMCLIKPFRVKRFPFIRDVGFYTVAVAALLVFLSDGVFMAWEAALLIGIYLLYVVTIVLGTWWVRSRRRRRAREALIRGEYDETLNPYVDEPEDMDEEYSDEDTPWSQPTLRNTRALSAPPNPELLGSSLLSSAPHSHPPSPSISPSDSLLYVSGTASTTSLPRSKPHRHHPRPMQRFSLLGAVEFRNVVQSFQRESSYSEPTAYDSLLFTPHAGGRYRSLPNRRGSAQFELESPQPAEQSNPFDEPYAGFSLVKASLSNSQTDVAHTVPPTITLIPPVGSPEEFSPTTPLLESIPAPKTSRRRRLNNFLLAASNTFFPTLHALPYKDWSGRILSVIAAPAVLALTLTLPVVVTRDLEESEDVLNEDKTLSEEEPFNKWLTVVQCILGPIFCAFIICGDNPWALWIILSCALGGLVIAVLVGLFAQTGHHPAGRLLRCFLGFGIAMVWIMAIADEVVRLLLILGLIFGLSDAIIGLTIFAVGNSLADFVANWTVASMGSPIMGLAACYAGPLLNVLLGLGVAGSYVAGTEGYKIELSNTLIVSAVGLLVILIATLVMVPWNGYWLTRKWGATLVIGYFVIMFVNILVELKL